MTKLQLGPNPRWDMQGNVFFVKNMMEIGPNLWLARYTEDKKGKSRFEHIALFKWKKSDNQFVWHQDGFRRVGAYLNLTTNIFSFYHKDVSIREGWCGDRQIALTTLMLLARTFLDPKRFFADRVYIYGSIFNEPTS